MNIAYNKKHACKEILASVLFQSVVMGIFSAALIQETILAMTQSQAIFIDRLLGLGYQLWAGRCIHFGTLTEIFIKVCIFGILQFVILVNLFYVFAMLYGKRDFRFTHLALAVGKSARFSAILMILSLPFVFFGIPALIPFFIFSFLASLVINHSDISKIIGVTDDKGAYLTSVVYMLYFLFIFICILDTIKL